MENKQCPRCGSENTYKRYYKKHKDNLYRCRYCNTEFKTEGDNK